MIPAQQVDLIWILNFQRHQQAHCLQLVTATINVVSQKQVVITFDVARFGAWRTPQIKEPHQILVLAVNVPEYLHGSLESQQRRLLLQYFLTLVC